MADEAEELRRENEALKERVARLEADLARYRNTPGAVITERPDLDYLAKTGKPA